MRHTYERINGRSVLVKTEGPLPGRATTYAWDADGSYVVATTTTAAATTGSATTGSATSTAGGPTTRDRRDATTGRLIERIGPDGLATRYAYELAFEARPSRIERGVDPATGSLAGATDYRFDALGRVTVVSQAAQAVSAIATGSAPMPSVLPAPGHTASPPQAALPARRIELRYDLAGHLVARTTLDAESTLREKL